MVERLTKTFVSSGKPARVSFRALSISCGVPSKNRPQPVNKLESSKSKPMRELQRTADEQRIAGEHCAVIAVLEEVADAILSVARRMKCLDLDTISDRKGIAVARCL